ncbi:MAG: hypothetical protein JJU35_14705, partial [Balneolales bacterium]|nr:hypothetical protein [Balneolales bacterium]
QTQRICIPQPSLYQLVRQSTAFLVAAVKAHNPRGNNYGQKMPCTTPKKIVREYEISLNVFLKFLDANSKK